MKSVIYSCIVFLCTLLSLVSCNSSDKPLKFAIVSDLHASAMPDGKERVQAVVDAANKENVDFLIQLGDFIRLDSISRSLDSIWNEYEGEKYHVLGNHDLDAYTKEEFLKGFGIPNRYYSFDKGDFHFIVLDGNNLYDGKEYRHYAKSNYLKAKSAMRAFVDPEQLEWLINDLAATDKKCILFSHQSIDSFMNNGDEVRAVLENANKHAGFKKVVLAFSGHNHSNYTKEINGITYIQINSASYVWVGKPTMTEKRYPQAINEKYRLLRYSITYDKPLYAIVTLAKDRIDIKGTQADFLPPTPQDLGLGDSIDIYPLVSIIADAQIDLD